MLLGAYRLNQTPIYLQRAQQLAAQAETLFFADGALPRASSQVSHYEAITRGDTLVMALLDLWAIQNRPDLDLGLIWSDR